LHGIEKGSVFIYVGESKELAANIGIIPKTSMPQTLPTSR
jgi:hypothetical protein